VPILHTQLAAQVKAPDGTVRPAHPRTALQHRGPVVQVSITLQQSMATALVELGKQVPQPITGWALIDTGASCTCIDDEAARQMQLPVIDVGTMSSASHAKTSSNIYPIQIEVTGFPIRFESPRTMGAALKEQDLLLLIGRDILVHCTLFYNGITGEITLAI
jgi:predicted aspartyl protease